MKGRMTLWDCLLMRRLRRGVSGAAALEFALVIVVALPLFVGLIEAGRALHSRNALEFAADVAARSTLVQLRSDGLGLQELEQRLQQDARAQWTTGAPERLSASVQLQDNRLRIELRYGFDFLIPLIPLDTITLRALRIVPPPSD